VLHGEAVAVGLMMAADYSVRTKTLFDAAPTQLAQLLTAFALPTALPKGLNKADFLQAMNRDKKTTTDGLRLVILRDLGRADVTSRINERALEQTLDFFLENASGSG
jgi:3-dehydroquinate synthase